MLFRSIQENENLEREIKALKESHNQLLGQLVKEKASLSIDNIASSNPCCEHANLVEENGKLKAQLEKGLASCIQGEKNLNDLISGQKENLGKEGLGFNSEPNKKTKKKKNKKNMSTPSSKPIVFVKEGELAKGKEAINKDVEVGSFGTIS